MAFIKRMEIFSSIAEEKETERDREIERVTQTTTVLLK